jgi:hypothetical protein
MIMRMTTTMTVLACTVVLTGAFFESMPTCADAALDCARVKELDAQGASPADIARTLGITTPDVQACLADAVDEPVMANPAGKLPLSPQRPIGDGPIRRAPDGQPE